MVLSQMINVVGGDKSGGTQNPARNRGEGRIEGADSCYALTTFGSMVYFVRVGLGFNQLFFRGRDMSRLTGPRSRR